MEKDWPNLEECPQYRYGLMTAALLRYPWEEDGYVFDFDSFYPPIPDESPWFRKLLESTKNKVWEEVWKEENIECCPICLPFRRDKMKSKNIEYCPAPVPMTSYDYDPKVERMRIEREKKEIREHPFWNMDPIPCPFHILFFHFYLPAPGSRSIMSPPCLVTPEQLESTKQFLKELRATRGYNVRSTMHPCLVSSRYFREDDLDGITCFNGSKKKTREFLKENYLNPLIVHINFKTKKIYKLVNILRSVRTWPLVLLTFSAAASPAPEQTFIATMSEIPLCPLSEIRPRSNPNILECLLLPDYDAPCKTHPVDEEEIRKESFKFIKRRMTDFLGDAETTEGSSTRKRELAEVGEGSHTVAQIRQKIVVAEERETEMTLPDHRGKDSMVDWLDASEVENLLKIVEEQQFAKEAAKEAYELKKQKRKLAKEAELKKRKLELEAELKGVLANLMSLESNRKDDSD